MRRLATQEQLDEEATIANREAVDGEIAQLPWRTHTATGVAKCLANETTATNGKTPPRYEKACRLAQQQVNEDA